MSELFHGGEPFASLGQHNRQQQQDHQQQMSINQMQLSDLALARGNWHNFVQTSYKILRVLFKNYYARRTLQYIFGNSIYEHYRGIVYKLN